MDRGSKILSNRWLLRTTGYCRSGNTYLNHTLKYLYYDNEPVNLNWHTVAKLDAREKIMVPFRNPLDCISSWHLYPSSYPLDADIRYYLRFHTAVLEKIGKVVLMDFDLFTKDLQYIKTKVSDNYGLSTDSTATIEQIKESMLSDGKTINLPRNNKTELDAVKAELQGMAGFNECVELYNVLKGSSIQD